VNKWGSTILLILVVGLFCLPAYSQTETEKANTETVHQQLQEYTAQLENISNQLEKEVISQERVDLYEKQLKRIQPKVTQIKIEANKNLQQQEDLLTVLGPAPEKNEPAEEQKAKAKREQIIEQITIYKGTLKLAESLLFEIKAIQDKLVGISLENKAKGLLARQEPLYDWQVWIFAWNDKKIATDTYLMDYKSLISDIVDFTPEQYGGVLLFYILLAIYISLPVGFFMYKKYGIRRKDAMPGTFRKLFTGVIQLISKAILPLVAVWIVISALKICGIINETSATLLVITFITINVIVLSHFIATITLPLRKPNWNIFALESVSAHRVVHRFCILMILVALNWYIVELFSVGVFSIDFYLALAFILRIAVCISGLMLLSKRNWVIEQENVEDIDRIHQHWVIYGIKILSVSVFLTNPIFILFGYLQLANAIFLSFIEIVLLILGLLAGHFVLKELLHRLFVGKQREQDKLVNTQRITKKAAIHYWIMLFIDFIFIILGAYFILLILGIGNDVIWRYVHPIFSGVKIGQYVFSINILLFAIFVFVVLFGLTRIIQKTLTKNVLPHTSFDLSAKQAIAQGVGYVGITVAIISGLLALGMSLTNLAIIAGALSVGIGFGLQHIVGNFISGIIMLIERPIKVGDRIVVGQDDGIVKKISVRATEIEDFEKSSVLIPNSELISGRVQNWTFHTPLNRMSVSVGVAYGTDVDLVKKLLLEVAAENENVVQVPEPRVYFDDFGDSALIFRLMVYIYDISMRNRTPSNLRFAIDKKFRENNIHIPFPQRDVHIKKDGE